MNEPDNFELKPEDSWVVRKFKESKTYMWFREPITNPNAIWNNWKELEMVKDE